MVDRQEPAENIGSSDGVPLGIPTDFEPDTPAATVVVELGKLFWQKSYGGQDGFTCLVRTILTQNTSDVASQPAFETLRDRFGNGSLLENLLAADESSIADAIRGAGLYDQKASVIKTCARWVHDEFVTAENFDEWLRDSETAVARERLLEIRGVGPKTADCVLLFAGGREGIFPVDTHVHRISRRMGVAKPDASHEDVRDVLESTVPPEQCGFGHTAMIQFGREYCTARSPACFDSEGCPLVEHCDQVGIDLETASVTDPANV